MASLTEEQIYFVFCCALILYLPQKSLSATEMCIRDSVSSLDTQKIVEGCMDRGLMGHGTGHVVYKISKEKGISIREASEKLAQGEYWDDAVALFAGGK